MHGFHPPCLKSLGLVESGRGLSFFGHPGTALIGFWPACDFIACIREKLKKLPHSSLANFFTTYDLRRARSSGGLGESFSLIPLSPIDKTRPATIPTPSQRDPHRVQLATRALRRRRPHQHERPRAQHRVGSFRRAPSGVKLPEIDPSREHLRPPVPPAGAPDLLDAADAHLTSAAAARRMLSSGDVARWRIASASMALWARPKFSISRPKSSRTWPLAARAPGMRSMSGRESVV